MNAWEKNSSSIKRRLGSLIVFLIVFTCTCVSPANAGDQVIVIAGHDIDIIQRDIAKDIMAEVYQTLGLDWEYIPLPSKRSMIQANMGNYHGELFRAAAVEAYAPNLIRIPYAIGKIQGMAFTRSGFTDIHSIKQLKGQRIGVLRGAALTAKYTQGLNPEVVTSVDSLFKILLSGHVDIILFSKHGGLKYLREHKLETKISMGSKALLNVNFYHYLHNSQGPLIAEVTEVLKQWQINGKLAGLINQHY